MSNSSLIAASVRYIGRLSFDAKLLSGVWILFAVLVAAGIHGSSTGIAAEWWSPEKPYTGYLFKVSPAPEGDPSSIERRAIRWLLMEDAKSFRSDEFTVATAAALSQFSQNPRFPVVNHSYGDGLNMLMIPQTPVWHIATLARPATWGYFLFGRQRGLAWLWWFQVFGCFTVLFLLFRTLIRGHSKLAAFGAFWFCASAYSVCWSNWPSHMTLFAALGCLSAYQIFASQKKSIQIICGALLGLSIPAFVMFIYPAWQVPLGYFVLVLFGALVIRDRLHQTAKVLSSSQLLALGIAAALAGGLTLSWLITCLPDLRAMSNTVYPGRRISTGGSYSLAELFRGTYNLLSIYNSAEQNFSLNPSEVSSYYYFFPAILLAVPFSKKVRASLGPIGWPMLAYILAMLFFLFVGIPSALAQLSQLSYLPPYRADITLGLASIVLCLCILAASVDRRADVQQAAAGFRPQLFPLAISGGVVIVFLIHGLRLVRFTGGFPLPQLIILMSLLIGLISYALLAGRKTVFCSIVALLVITTTATFNPLATNLDHIFNSELARKVTEIDSQSATPPMWACYGGSHIGALVSILGGRSLTGIQWTPQLKIWHTLDPEGLYEKDYNSYNEISFISSTDDNRVVFISPRPGVLWVQISPNNPMLRSLGVRYIVQWADARKAFDTTRLKLIYRSPHETFSIFEIPE